MKIKVRRAIIAGIVGCVIVVAAVKLAGHMSGSDADLCTLAGVVVTGSDDAPGWFVGCAVQLLIAVVAALMYAVIFEWITHRANALIGLAVGIPHAVTAGMAVGFLPVARLIAVGILPPGAFLEYRGGWVVATFVLGHLTFGAVVGALYGPVRHDVPSVNTIWRDVTDADSA